MAKIAREAKITGKVSKNDLPDKLDAVIYYCGNCRGKHTFGADYFVEVGAPVKCPNCDTPFVQEDQVHRYTDETEDVVKMKRDDLYRKRGEEVPVEVKPEDPDVLKQREIERLENEIKKLKGQPVPGIKLGP